MEAIIYKGIGGFYYVKTKELGLLEVKPRGIFRKRKQKPLAGDKVVLCKEADTFVIEEILPRKNVFVRPPIANVDRVFLVASTIDPSPSFFVLDKLSAVAIDQGAEVFLLITKTDLATEADLLSVYKKAGFPVFCINAESGDGIEEVRSLLQGKLSVFCGNSGVGKSTLLNALCPLANRSTAQISKKLGRGRHTTREVEILEVGTGLVADTPGFASFDLQQVGGMLPENIQLAFPEIKERIPQCRFSGCSHLAETGCAVRDALQRGEIANKRYESYCTLYRQLKENERY